MVTGSCVLCCASLLSRVWLFATPWTVASQAPLSMGILQAGILAWFVMPSSRGSSQPRDWTQVSCIAGGFFKKKKKKKKLIGSYISIITLNIKGLSAPRLAGWMKTCMCMYVWGWVSSRSCWWTGKPGVLQSMGSQRVGHDWATELNWTEEWDSTF